MNEPHDIPEGGTVVARDLPKGSPRDSRRSTRMHADSGFGFDGWASAQAVSRGKRPLELGSIREVPNIVYEAHLYFDHDGSGKYGFDYAGESEAESRSGIARASTPYNRSCDWCEQNEVQGFIGEFGVPADEPWQAHPRRLPAERFARRESADATGRRALGGGTTLCPSNRGPGFSRFAPQIAYSQKACQ